MELGELRNEYARSVQYCGDAEQELFRRQILEGSKIYADEPRALFERLTVHPVLAARNHRQLACSQRLQLLKRARIGEDVARLERNIVFAKELLSAQTAGSAGLPVHLDGFLGRRGLHVHADLRCRSEKT